MKEFENLTLFSKTKHTMNGPNLKRTYLTLEYKKSFGLKIREKRISLKISMRQMAEHLGVSHNQIYLYEQGINFPCPEKLDKILSILELPQENFQEPPTLLHSPYEHLFRTKMDLFLKDFKPSNLKEQISFFIIHQFLKSQETVRSISQVLKVLTTNVYNLFKTRKFTLRHILPFLEKFGIEFTPVTHNKSGNTYFIIYRSLTNANNGYEKEGSHILYTDGNKLFFRNYQEFFFKFTIKP